MILGGKVFESGLYRVEIVYNQMYSKHTGKPIAIECLMSYRKKEEDNWGMLFTSPQLPKRGLISHTCGYDYSIEGQLGIADKVLGTNFEEHNNHAEVSNPN